MAEKDFSIHIVRDDLLIVAVNNRHIPSELCHRIRADIEEKVPGVHVLVFSYSEVIDNRSTPPPVVEAADTLREWLGSL